MARILLLAAFFIAAFFALPMLAEPLTLVLGGSPVAALLLLPLAAWLMRQRQLV